MPKSRGFQTFYTILVYRCVYVAWWGARDFVTLAFPKWLVCAVFNTHVYRCMRYVYAHILYKYIYMYIDYCILNRRHTSTGNYYYIPYASRPCLTRYCSYFARGGAPLKACYFTHAHIPIHPIHQGFDSENANPRVHRTACRGPSSSARRRPRTKRKIAVVTRRYAHHFYDMYLPIYTVFTHTDAGKKVWGRKL